MGTALRLMSTEECEMPVDVQVPKLGLTMREGTVSRWVADDGAEVGVGDVLYLLTTDKVETEITAEAGGTLHHAVAEGTTLEPGGTAGWLLGEGEEPPAGSKGGAGGASRVPSGEAAPAQHEPESSSGNGTTSSAQSAGNSVRSGDEGRLLASPNAKRVAAELGVALRGVKGTGPGGRITSEDVEAAAAAPSRASDQGAAGRSAANQAAAVGTSDAVDGGGRGVLASPVAVRLAERLGIDLVALAGTGPGGRITLDDVTSAAGAGDLGGSATAEARAGQPAGSVHRAGDEIPLRGMRGVIAERMHQSLQEMAQLTMGRDVRMDRAVALRAQLGEEWGATGPVPGYTDLVVKAVAVALTRHPLLNATVADGAVRLLHEVHVGLAVALDDGLVVPVVRNADLLPLDAVAAETARLATAARSGGLGLDEMQGGTFSVTALGSGGIDFFTPVVNPPNVAILGVGRIRDGVAWDGDVAVRTKLMTLSLTIDHRAVDGTPGAAFLATVAELLESPLRLLATT